MTRPAAVERVRRQLLSTGNPRAEVLAIVALAGVGAFLFSAALLWAGVDRMAWRYPLAVVVGYGLFVLLVRMWVGWRRSDSRHDLPLDPLPDLPLSLPDDPAPGRVLFAGGKSGGAGGGASWQEPGTRVKLPDVSAALDADGGELWPVAVIILALVGGALAILYSLYIAPVLLAEVIVDAAVMTTVYRGLREDRASWAASVLRRTWIPAAGLTVLLLLAGFAVERIAPSARSIGGVIRALLG